LNSLAASRGLPLRAWRKPASSRSSMPRSTSGCVYSDRVRFCHSAMVAVCRLSSAAGVSASSGLLSASRISHSACISTRA
jgi:hypothetical protein